MGGRDLELRNLGNVTVDPVQALAAVRNIARRFGQDPAELLELLKILGLPTTRRGLDALKARAAVDRAAREQHSKERT
jgi:alkylhydroperoxidase family enzyme